MKKPYPADFDLTEKEIKRFKNQQRILKWLCILGFPAIPAVFIVVDLKDAKWFHFPLIWIGCAWPLGAMIGFGIHSVLVRIFFPRYTNYFSAIKKYNNWFIRTQREFWNRLDGRSFEREVAFLLQRAGYKAQLTPVTGDEGVDIVLGDGTIVQCKAHKSPVSPGVARELYGTLRHFSVHKAILISRSGFTGGVQRFARGKRISLWDLDNLISLQKKLEE